MAVTGRDHYKNVPVRARIGVSRALINANVPWEHVTTRNLRAGLGPRYPVIYLPAFIALTDDLQRLLEDYVRQGGRLVIDMPGAYFDGYGRIVDTGESSWFERVFGCTLDEFHYGRPINTPRSVGETEVAGFVAKLTPTRCEVLARYNETRLPAVTECRCGEGTGVVIGFEASGACLRPGNAGRERLLLTHALGNLKSPYRCDAIAYRIVSPNADHYFLINDGKATEAALSVEGTTYDSFTDAVTGERLTSPKRIQLDGYSGRWIRAEKQAR
jgi:beta-galactosidase